MNKFVFNAVLALGLLASATQRISATDGNKLFTLSDQSTAASPSSDPQPGWWHKTKAKSWSAMEATDTFFGKTIAGQKFWKTGMKGTQSLLRSERTSFWFNQLATLMVIISMAMKVSGWHMAYALGATLLAALTTSWLARFAPPLAADILGLLLGSKSRILGTLHILAALIPTLIKLKAAKKRVRLTAGITLPAMALLIYRFGTKTLSGFMHGHKTLPVMITLLITAGLSYWMCKGFARWNEHLNKKEYAAKPLGEKLKLFAKSMGLLGEEKVPVWRYAVVALTGVAVWGGHQWYTYDEANWKLSQLGGDLSQHRQVVKKGMTQLEQREQSNNEQLLSSQAETETGLITTNETLFGDNENGNDSDEE